MDCKGMLPSVPKELADVTSRPLSIKRLQWFREVPEDWSKHHSCLQEEYKLVSLTLMPKKQIILKNIAKCIKDKRIVGSHQYGFMKGKNNQTKHLTPDQHNSFLQWDNWVSWWRKKISGCCLSWLLTSVSSNTLSSAKPSWRPSPEGYTPGDDLKQPNKITTQLPFPRTHWNPASFRIKYSLLIPWNLQNWVLNDWHTFRFLHSSYPGWDANLGLCGHGQGQLLLVAAFKLVFPKSPGFFFFPKLKVNENSYLIIRVIMISFSFVGLMAFLPLISQILSDYDFFR